ncbi:MAG: methyltransferase family protein [Ignavibacteria bacterium]
MLFTAIKSLVYGSIFVLFWGVIALNVRKFDRYFSFSLPVWTPVAGIVLMAAGGILALICAAVFVRRGRGTPAPFDPPREFVITGPYKYVRNPMYLGGFLLLLGFALYNHSVSMILFWLLAMCLSHFFVVFFEEKRLEKSFGSSYVEYRKTVNRWVPKIPNPR